MPAKSSKHTTIPLLVPPGKKFVTWHADTPCANAEGYPWQLPSDFTGTKTVEILQ